MTDQMVGLSVERPGQPSPDPTWLTYWNAKRNARELIDKEESQDYVTRLRASVPIHERQTVLDFGCGSGEPARLLAPYVGRLFLWDAAPSVRDRARVKTAGLGNVDLIDLTDATRDPAGALDLIVVNSVVQYMSRPEFEMWMRRWANMLAPGGAVVVSDMPRPESSFIGELGEFLLFAQRRGIFIEALRHGFRDIANYRAARGARPLMRAEPAVFEAMSAAAGLHPTWLGQNLTFRRHRLSLVLRKPAD